MTERSNSLDPNGQLTPREALTASRREYSVENEGQWLFDIRAGFVQLKTVTPERIIVTAESGELILLGTAVDLYQMCRSRSVYPIRTSAIENAQPIVISLAKQRLDKLTRRQELDDKWSPTDSATTIADAQAALHFFEQTVEREWTMEDFLSTEFRHGP